MQNLQRLELLLPMSTVILLISTTLTPLMAFLPSLSYFLTQLCLQMVPGDHPPYKLRALRSLSHNLRLGKPKRKQHFPI